MKQTLQKSVVFCKMAGLVGRMRPIKDCTKILTKKKKCVCIMNEHIAVMDYKYSASAD